MTDQPVTPDREALIRASVEGRLAAHPGITPHLRHVVAEAYRDEAEPFVDALLPLLAEALDRARQQGWRDHWEYVIRGGGSDLGEPGDLDQLRAERDQALSLLRQVRNELGDWDPDRNHAAIAADLIDSSGLLDDEGQQR